MREAALREQSEDTTTTEATTEIEESKQSAAGDLQVKSKQTERDE